MNSMNKTSSKTFIHIKPSKGWQFIRFREINEYRDLLYFLTVRDIKIKYSQTVLGGLWAIIQPFFSMIVFSIVFGKLGKIPSDGVPYPLFSFAALVPWGYFTKALGNSADSLTGNSSLISKVYFPRLIIPLAAVLGGLVDFAMGFAALICMMVYFQFYPTASMALVPLLLLLTMVTAYGVGMFLAALNAKYRDFRNVTSFLIQLWMFVSPIAYPTSLVPERYKFFFILNPLAGIIEGFRWALLQNIPFPGHMLLCSTWASLMLFIIGFLYFKQMERFFADII